MAEPQRLSLDALNARLTAAPQPQRLSLDDLNRRLVPPSEPAEPIPTSRTARLKAYQSAMDQQSAQQTAPALLSLPTQTMMGREQFARALEQMGRPPLGERFMAHGREGFANTLAGQGVLNARSGAIEQSRADLLDRIIANARQQGSDVGVPLPPITDKNTGAPLSDPNRDASDLVGDYVGVPLADLEHKAKTARARYNVQSRPVLEAERQRQAEFAAIPPAQGVLEHGAAVAGALAGSAPSPENLVPVGRGATVARTFGKGVLAGGAVAGLTDPIIQQSQVRQGLREQYDPTQTAVAALAGGTLSGILNVTPEFARSLIAFAARRFGKPEQAVTVGEVSAVMGREPAAESAGAEAPSAATVTGPKGEMAAPASPGAAGESVPVPRSLFVEHRVGSGLTQQRQPVYQGAIRGPAFEPRSAPILPPVSRPPATAAEPSPAVIPHLPDKTLTVGGSSPAGPAQAPSIRGLPPGAILEPASVKHGDPGTLGKAVPRTDTALVNMLDRADARRFAPVANKEFKAAAAEAQTDFLAQLDALEARAAQSQYGRMVTAAKSAAAKYQPVGAKNRWATDRESFQRGFLKAVSDPEIERPNLQRMGDPAIDGTLAGLEFRKLNPAAGPLEEMGEIILRTARGRQTRFNVRLDPEVIAEFRKKFEGSEALETFYNKAPGGGSSRRSIEQMNSALAGETQPQRMTLERLNSTLAMTPGANYVGAAPQTFNPAIPRTAGEPIRREAILRDLMTALGASLYQGRIKSAKTLGFFRPKIEEVRIRKGGDIETAAHEIAHLLDDRIPEIRRQWNPATTANAPIRAEIAGVSYDKTKLYEGFAEFVRLWATQPNQARAKAPLFYQWFESFIGRSEYGPALRRMQTNMLNWFEQAAVDRARSKIGGGPEINDGLVKPFDKFRQTVVDDLQGIKGMEETLTGKLNPVGAYETARLVRGKSALIEGALTMGVPVVNPDGSHSFRGKGLQQILDPVTADLDDFLMYSVGRAASELKQQGRENLFTAAEIQGMLALDRPEFQRAFAEYQTWNKGILDFAEAKGVINPVSRQYWQRANYLPFHRVGQPGQGKGTTPGDWAGIKELRGGTSNLRPVLQNIIGNASMLIDAGLTNEVRQKVAQLAGRQGGARFMAKIPKEDRSIKVSTPEVERAILEALGVRSANQLTPEQAQVVDQIVNNMGGFVQFILRGQKPVGPNVVAALQGGEPVFYEVADPLLYRALTSLNRPVQNWLVRALSLPKRIGQASITLTPDFMAANILRDTISAGVFSQHGFRPFLDSAKGFKSRLMRDQNYREFVANGGGLASHLLDEGNFRRHLEKFYTRKGIDYRTVLDAPSKLLAAVERLADSFETATRIGEYRRAVQQGEHPRHAAYGAREVSTDFAMRGDQHTAAGRALSFLYDTIIFLKAGTVSIDRFYRGMAQDPNRGSIAAKTAGLAALSAALYMMNRGNPLYEQMEDWDRDTHWHFFIPTPETVQAWGDDRPLPPIEDRYLHFRLPKIWEIGGIGSIAERQLQGVLDGQPLQAQVASAKIIANLFGFEYLPQVFAPLYEVLTNRQRFTGRQIETQAMQEMEPWARAAPHTSRVMRWLGEQTRDLPRGLQVSPAQVEHLLRGYFNTWALYGLSTIDAAFFDDKPDMRTDQLPVVRRFFRDEPAQNTKYLSQLYEAIDAATETRRTMRFMDRTWRPEIAGELEKKVENRLYSQLNTADQQLRVYRKEIEQIYRMPSLPELQKFADERARATRNPSLTGRAKFDGAWDDLGALKRFLIDDIIRERNAYAVTVMGDVEARRGELQGEEPE